MEANDPWDVTNLDPKGMIGRICVGNHLLYAKTLAVGLMVAVKKIV